MFNQLLVIALLLAPGATPSLDTAYWETAPELPRIQLVSNASALLAEYKKALEQPNDPQARATRCRLGEVLLNSHASALAPETVAYIFAQLGRDRCHG